MGYAEKPILMRQARLNVLNYIKSIQTNLSKRKDEKGTTIKIIFYDFRRKG